MTSLPHNRTPLSVLEELRFLTTLVGGGDESLYGAAAVVIQDLLDAGDNLAMHQGPYDPQRVPARNNWYRVASGG